MSALQSGTRPAARLAIGVAASVCFSLLLSGCEQRTTDSKAAPQEKSAPHDAFPNDTALFLAGLKGPPDGPYRELEQTEAWKSYAARFDQTWQKALRLKMEFSAWLQALSSRPKVGILYRSGRFRLPTGSRPTYTMRVASGKKCTW